MMQKQMNNKVNNRRNSYPDATAVELRQQQKRQEILRWLSENAASAHRSAWSA
jgi:hypothetical protein